MTETRQCEFRGYGNGLLLAMRRRTGQNHQICEEQRSSSDLGSCPQVRHCTFELILGKALMLKSLERLPSIRHINVLITTLPNVLGPPTNSSQSCQCSPLLIAAYSSSDTSSTRNSGLALSKGVDTSVSSALDSESRALDAGENVVGVVKLLSRGAGGGDAREEEPVDCGETWLASSLRKASKSKSTKGSLLAGVGMLKGWRVILGPCMGAGGGRRAKKSLNGGGAMGIDGMGGGGGGGGGGGYGMPVKLYGEASPLHGPGGGNGG